ncbi:MAG: tetratricopeptide repeat protein [Crocinitomicaceae bacterium]|nr:tetratricopeptide repeat protein [Crocinitomicaceae bacterium]MDG1776567.1 tetratricopeptide repeat protein [Crocinitomicaceae bacterium]
MIGSSFGQEWRDSITIARESYANKDYLNAFNSYTSIQKKTPNHIRLNNELAQSAYKAGNFEISEELYQKNTTAEESSVDRASNVYNIGNTRMKRNDYKGAIEAYKNALRINPDDAKTRYNLSAAIRQLNKNEKKDHSQQEKNNNQENKQNTPEDSPKKMPSKTADKILDKLMKEEAETKQKLRNRQGTNRSSKSEKDW